jgi:hypothetical protein
MLGKLPNERFRGWRLASIKLEVRCNTVDSLVLELTKSAGFDTPTESSPAAKLLFNQSRYTLHRCQVDRCYFFIFNVDVEALLNERD